MTAKLHQSVLNANFAVAAASWDDCMKYHVEEIGHQRHQHDFRQIFQNEKLQQNLCNVDDFNWQTLPETPGPQKNPPKNTSQLQRAQRIHESLCIHGTTPTDCLTLRLALHGCLHIGALPRQMVFTQQKVQLERNLEKRKSECANGARVHSYVLFPRIITES